MDELQEPHCRRQLRQESCINKINSFFFIFLLFILIISRFLSPINAPFYYTHKMLKRTVKISLCLLLHVSVQLDHPQGAYAEPC
jgi:hypothetical protein